MNAKHQHALRGILSNSHLKEWNDNLTLERKNRYVLDSKHKQERGLAFLEDNNLLKRVGLIAKHARELEELINQSSLMRNVIQKRHLQEDAQLDQELGQKSR